MRQAKNLVKNKSIFIFNQKRDEFRLGNSYEVEDGDICVATAHSGDCFNDYIVIKQENGVFKKTSKFSSYVFGIKLGELEDREYFKLLAGDDVKIDYLEDIAQISKELKILGKQEEEINEKKHDVEIKLYNFINKKKF